MSVTLTVRSPVWKCIAGCCTQHGCATNPGGIQNLNRTCGIPARHGGGMIDDLKYGDYITRPMPNNFSGYPESQWGNDQLLTQLRARLQIFGAGSLGNTMVDHFMTGNGQPRIWGSPLAGMVHRDSNFFTFLSTSKRLIWEGLQREGLNTTRARYTFYWRSEYFGWPEFNSGILNALLFHPPGQALSCVIGGISGWKIFARNLIVHATNHATVQLRFEICDHFGADSSDNYESGIRCLWLLQHARPGPQRPFCNLIAVEESCSLPAPPSPAPGLRLI